MVINSFKPFITIVNFVYAVEYDSYTGFAVKHDIQTIRHQFYGESGFFVYRGPRINFHCMMF